ncbi:MAG: long-chain fatty acid--CoA ligase [Paludibacter sp.]|nr:long-chain fatty acid--CoA ligase [Paludibacter sp.]
METLHFADLIQAQANKYGDKTALNHRKSIQDAWTQISWKSFAAQVTAMSKALYELGVIEGDRIGQFSNNMAENLIVDYALFANRAVVVPMYATSTTLQIEFIVNDSEIALLFVGDQLQYDIAVEVMEHSRFLKKIVVFDREVALKNDRTIYFEELLEQGYASSRHFEVQNRMQEAVESDLACILYTSGTTGNPKGVMMPHSCLNEAIRVHTVRIPQINDQQTSIAFLPLSHVFERMWCYLCIARGVEIYINLRPIEITDAIKQVRPTMMCAVPRFWEKVYAAVQGSIAKMTPFKQGIVAWALATGKKYNIDYLRLEKVPPFTLKLKYLIADKLIYAKVKKTIGIERAVLFPVAGAKLSDEINLFLRSMGIPIVYGYGLTESTASVSFFDHTGYEFGTVGKIIPDLEVKIGPDNEILLKGKTIFPGYYKNPTANETAFTEDGFFRTGDAGYIRGENIILTDRIKDLFKTSYGKYIAPQEIETRLVLDQCIEQVAVIGDEKPYVTAIIAPSIPDLVLYAEKQKIRYKNIAELLVHPAIYNYMEQRIQRMQAGMANHELIKKFALITKPFSIQGGELTNTLKLKRAVILQRYKVQIDEMYAL